MNHSLADADPGSATPMTSLRRLIRRTHLKGALIIVLITSLCMMGAGMWTIGRYADMYLQLLARTLAYNVEAAMVFNDKVEVQQIIDSIAEPEGLLEAVVEDVNGTALGAFSDLRPASVLANRLSSLVIEQPVIVPIVHQGQTIGRVTVRIQGNTLIGFLAAGVLLLLLALLFSAGVATMVARRLQSRLSKPWGQLSDTMRHIAKERSFHERIPATHIAELDALGCDINSLISEVERWQSKLEGEKAQLAYHAEHDALTGAANRRQLEPLFAQAVQETGRAGVGFALLAIDCDDFKQINDRYGHALGDQVLKSLVQTIKAIVRKSDAIIRTGGDEFVILIAGVHDRESVRFIAEKIVRAVDGFSLLKDKQEVQLSISVGASMYPEDSRDLGGLMAMADAEMYSMKRKIQAPEEIVT
ncbi:diguanylate cyclase [Lampropedia aestuarii]|uniref:Diguanylate cyclase n=1 Tax=Lampropedia aestuarii TaxID=2562762 RepID=A0A4S5BK95_9BURK|nr:diguanylate cyclase [Lampropedia aestuarii]THJ32770.1 diguanylate cyclase [Lampropedia aestuarii]